MIPKVSIGMPVYNNSRYISEAIDSILNQSFTNFNLYISDNYSSDGTSDICQAYAKNDIRIKYYKNDENLGAAANFHKALVLGTTDSCDYFIFARSEAILAPKLLEEMVNNLERNTGAVLAYPRTVWIDENGKPIENKPVAFYDTMGYDVGMRIAMVLWTKPFQIYGLIRSQFVKGFISRKWWQIIGYDHVFLLELTLNGSFCFVENEKWFRRYKYTGETYHKRLDRYKNNVLQNPNISDSLFPYFKIPYYCLKAVNNSELKFIDKLKCSFIIFFTAPLRYMISRGKQV
tara:strand:+ start:1018 stop:1884 length:867 start_codon:yes stop_codon:yes gene_type:complete